MKRYDIAQAPQGGVMVQDEDGDYVRIEDVRELVNAARLALECIERHVPATTFAPREALRAALGAGPYNAARIAWELERTAMGDGFHGNALRVAKDIPGLTADDRALLDRYATGRQGGTDHVALQDLAVRIDRRARLDGAITSYYTDRAQGAYGRGAI